MKSLNLKKIFIFLFLTCLINWSLALIFYLSGGKWNTPGSFVMTYMYMLIPMTVAFFVQKVIYKEEMKIQLGINFKINKWWFVGWLFPPLLAFASFGLALLFPGISYTPDMQGLYERYSDLVTPEQYAEMQKQMSDLPVPYVWLGLAQGLLAGISINALAGFGEELGWRGFLFNESRLISFWPQSFLTGLIWGVWHFPIILMGHNYPDHPVEGVFMMILLCILLAPLFGFVRIKSGSVIAAAIFHGTFNATAGFGLLLLKGGNDLTVGMPGLAGLIVLAIANSILYVFIKFQGNR